MFITPQAEFDQARFMGLRKRRISLYTGLQLVLFGLCWVIKCARRAAAATEWPVQSMQLLFAEDPHEDALP